MSRADWVNIVHLIGNIECISILGVDPEPYKSAYALVSAVIDFPDEEDSDWDETQRAAYNGLSSTDYHFPD